MDDPHQKQSQEPSYIVYQYLTVLVTTGSGSPFEIRMNEDGATKIVFHLKRTLL
jgi:hypothetical protein